MISLHVSVYVGVEEVGWEGGVEITLFFFKRKGYDSTF